MDLVYIYIVMVQNMLVNGKMIYKMVKEMKNGQMDLNMKVIIMKVKNMDMVKYILQMVLHIKDNFKWMIYMVKVYINGLMVKYMKDNGKIIKWMVKVH